MGGHRPAPPRIFPKKEGIFVVAPPTSERGGSKMAAGIARRGEVKEGFLFSSVVAGGGGTAAVPPHSISRTEKKSDERRRKRKRKKTFAPAALPCLALLQRRRRRIAFHFSVGSRIATAQKLHFPLLFLRYRTAHVLTCVKREGVLSSLLPREKKRVRRGRAIFSRFLKPRCGPGRSRFPFLSKPPPPPFFFATLEGGKVEPLLNCFPFPF